MKRRHLLPWIALFCVCLLNPTAVLAGEETDAEKAWAKFQETRAKELEKQAEEAAKLAAQSAEKQAKEAAKLAEKEAKFYAKRYKDRSAGKGPWGGKHGGAGATHVPIVDEDFEFMVAWTRDRLAADAAHQHARGRGVTVAVLDGGFNLAHPAIAPHVSPFGYDAIDEDWDPEDLGNGCDDDLDGFADSGVGHGTFVAGMVLLAAPEATILPIRVRADEGGGYNRELERGLAYAWASGADIVNISGAAPLEDYKHVAEVLDEMRAAGIVVVVATGNEGSSALPAMAARDDTIAVAATDEHDRLADFSNFGPTSGGVLLAPGVGLYGPLGWRGDDTSGYWSGTSFSAGLVSGAAALVLDARPWLWPSAVRARLLQTADPAFDDQDRPLARAGRINLDRAVTQ